MSDAHCPICGWAAAIKLADGNLLMLPDVENDALCPQCRSDRDEAALVITGLIPRVKDMLARGILRRASKLLLDKTGLLEHDMATEIAGRELLEMGVARKAKHDTECNCGARIFATG